MTIRSTTKTTEFRKLLKMFPKRPSVVAEGDSWFAHPRKNMQVMG